MRKEVFIFIFLATFSKMSHGVVKNNQTCGIEPGKPLHNHYGPFDYTNPAHQEKFPVVTNRHFTQEIKTLRVYNAEADLDYTLRAIPNHLPALMSMIKYHQGLDKNEKANTEVYSLACYFKRAIYFAPHDVKVRQLFAVYLHRSGDLKGAKNIYLQVLRQSPNNLEVHYNLGLLYIELNELSNAKQHAEIAYEGKYPLQGLKNKLAALGAW